MAGRNTTAADRHQPTRPKNTRDSSVFVTASAQQQAIVRGNVATAGRRGSIPKSLPVASQNRGPVKGQRDNTQIRPAQEPHGTTVAKQSTLQFYTSPLPSGLPNAAPSAGKPGRPPAEGVANLAAPPAVRQEDQPPSLRLEPGDVRAPSGHEEDAPEGAVACVLVYLCVVLLALAALLAYVYRSLLTGPPEMGLSTLETTTFTSTKPLATTVKYKVGRGATWTVPRPLATRRATAASRGPKARGLEGSESTASTGTASESDASEEDREAGGTKVLATAAPDEDAPSFESVVLAAPG